MDQSLGLVEVEVTPVAHRERSSRDSTALPVLRWIPPNNTIKTELAGAFVF